MANFYDPNAYQTSDPMYGLSSISGSGDGLNVPNSPMGAPSTLNQLQSINGYQSWANSKGLGDYLGANGKMFANYANLAAGGIQAYLGLQQLGMAKKAFGFEKKAFKTNLKNSVASYNTQMNDRITGRYYATEAERQAALKAAELDPNMSGG
jgi:hypothetical protein